jgi:hypothetical protein
MRSLVVGILALAVLGGSPALAGAPAKSSAAGFDQKLELQGITFHVTCPNDSSAPTVTITPSGLAIDNSAMKQEAEGHVVLAERSDDSLLFSTEETLDFGEDTGTPADMSYDVASAFTGKLGRIVIDLR